MNYRPPQGVTGAALTGCLKSLTPMLLLSLLLLSILPGRSQAPTAPPAVGFWTQTVNIPPDGIDTTLLQTDGTVLCHTGDTRNWYRLTPDAFGSYVNGTWSTIAPLPVGYAPLYFASAVLADGRTIVIGGEYNAGSQTDTNQGAIYNPLTNTWTPLTPPTWNGSNQIVGDAQCCVLPNGKFMLAFILDGQSAILDPATLTWSLNGVAGKADRNDEEGWTLLPNGKILTVDVTSHLNNSRNSELYNIATNAWSSAGDTKALLYDAGSQEMGPQVLRPDGTVFCVGATTHTSVFNYLTGVWTAGPDFPNGLDAADGPACLMPNGNVLVIVSPGIFQAGAKFFEWDGTSLNAAPSTPNTPQLSSFFTRMIDLPNGQIMFTDTTQDVEIYTPSGGPQTAWRPTITSAPANLAAGSTNNAISGTQFNGLSQASAYGDDATNATNYPLVRLTSHTNGHVTYCRTHNHSTMAVATGSAVVSTQFDVPAGLASGAYDLEVVANGIPSAIRTVNVGVQGPTANPQSVTTAHNTAKQITLTGTDPNNPPQPLTFAIGTNPAHGSLSGFNASTGAVTYTPTTGYHGADSFTFTVTNTSMLTSAPATVSITVGAATPVANAQTAAVSHDTAKAVTLSGNDGDDNPPINLTYVVTVNPTHGSLTGTAPNLTYTPNTGFYGADSFKFTVSNGINTSAAATVTLNVAPATPTANPQSVTTNQNTAVGITLTGTDGDDSPPLSLTFAVTVSPTHGALSGTAPNLTYTPNSGYSGSDSFQFTASNGTNTSAAATVSITVSGGVADVSSQVTIVKGPIFYNNATKQFSASVKLTNTGATTINGPISLILGGLPAGVTLANKTGDTSAILPAGRPYYNLPVASLAHGGSVQVTLLFNDPTKAPFNYTTQVVAGVGPR